MKKNLKTVLAVVALLSMVGCAGGNGTSDSQGGSLPPVSNPSVPTPVEDWDDLEKAFMQNSLNGHTLPYYPFEEDAYFDVGTFEGEETEYLLIEFANARDYTNDYAETLVNAGYKENSSSLGNYYTIEISDEQVIAVQMEYAQSTFAIVAYLGDNLKPITAWSDVEKGYFELYLQEELPLLPVYVDAYDLAPDEDTGSVTIVDYTMSTTAIHEFADAFKKAGWEEAANHATDGYYEYIKLSSVDDAYYLDAYIEAVDFLGMTLTYVDVKLNMLPVKVAGWPSEELATHFNGNTDFALVPSIDNGSNYSYTIDPYTNAFTVMLSVDEATYLDFVNKLENANFYVDHENETERGFLLTMSWEENLDVLILYNNGRLILQFEEYMPTYDVIEATFPSEDLDAFLGASSSVPYPNTVSDSGYKYAIKTTETEDGTLLDYFYLEMVDVNKAIPAAFQAKLEAAGYTVTYDASKLLYTAKNEEITIYFYSDNNYFVAQYISANAGSDVLEGVAYDANGWTADCSDLMLDYLGVELPFAANVFPLDAENIFEYDPSYGLGIGIATTTDLTAEYAAVLVENGFMEEALDEETIGYVFGFSQTSYVAVTLEFDDTADMFVIAAMYVGDEVAEGTAFDANGWTAEFQQVMTDTLTVQLPFGDFDTQSYNDYEVNTDQEIIVVYATVTNDISESYAQALAEDGYVLDDTTGEYCKSLNDDGSIYVTVVFEYDSMVNEFVITAQYVDESSVAPVEQSYTLTKDSVGMPTAYDKDAPANHVIDGKDFTLQNCAVFDKNGVKALQFKKSGGFLQAVNCGNLSSIQIVIEEGATGTLTVQGSTDSGATWTDVAANADGSYDMTGYTSYKIINNSTNVARATSITVTFVA